MKHLCPIPQKNNVANDIEIICTTHNTLEWGCDECPDLQPWRTLYGKRQAFIEKELAVHRPEILKKAKEKIKP